MICAFFCGRTELQNRPDLSSKLPQLMDLSFFLPPLVAMVISYVMIYVKMWTSRNSLKLLGMAAFNTRRKEVRIF